MSASLSFLKKLLIWPLAINLPLWLLFYWVEGPEFSMSLLAGAFVCWLANLVFAVPLLQKIKHRSKQHFLMLFYGLECLKLCLYAVLFIVILIVWQLDFEPMLLGFILNIVAYGLISLISLGDY